MRWRLAAQTEDEEVAAGVMELLVRRCFGVFTVSLTDLAAMFVPNA